MNIIYPNGAVVTIPKATQADDLPNGNTVFRDDLGALTVSGALVLPDGTDYKYEAPENNPHVHDGH